MIFDSRKMEKLRRKYENEFDLQIPKIVLLDRIEKFAGERLNLEKLIALIQPEKQKTL